MTQIIHLNKVFPASDNASAHPNVRTTKSLLDLGLGMARLLIKVDEFASSELNMRAVGRVNDEMTSLQDSKLISSFEIRGWRGDELKVAAIVPERHYNRDDRLAIRRKVSSLLDDLDLHVQLRLELADVGQA